MSEPTNAQLASSAVGVDVHYHLYHPDANPFILVGSAVISTDGLCPAFLSDDDLNIFGHYFGIKFTHEGHTYVCTLLSFEFVSCHCLFNDLSYQLAHPSNTFCFVAAVPGWTSACVFEKILKRCHQICASNCNIFSPRQYAAPAACAQAFLNGAIGIRLPDRTQWIKAYHDDPTMSSIIGFINNPGSITNKSLIDSMLNANYRSALRKSHIFD